MLQKQRKIIKNNKIRTTTIITTIMSIYKKGEKISALAYNVRDKNPPQSHSRTVYPRPTRCCCISSENGINGMDFRVCYHQSSACVKKILIYVQTFNVFVIYLSMLKLEQKERCIEREREGVFSAVHSMPNNLAHIKSALNFYSFATLLWLHYRSKGGSL